jgi:hypothetical protein
MHSVEYLKKYSKLVKVLRILSQIAYWLSVVAVAILLPLAIYLSVCQQALVRRLQCPLRFLPAGKI